jgi:predicted nucleic acid-binding protein
MKPVFADTSYYIALLSEEDVAHALAMTWSETLLGRIFVTEYVLVELGNALSRSKYRDRYVPLVESLISDPDTVFIPASRKLLEQGLQLYASRPDKAWSMVDCISFVVMKQRRLTDALTTDHHFKQAQFRPLLASDS